MIPNKGEIFYTIDGSDPNSTKSIFDNFIEINSEGTTVVKFIIVNDGKKSPVFTETYYIDTNINSTPLKARKNLEIPIKIPKGMVSDIMGVLNYIQTKFDDVEIEIKASKGSITDEDYEIKILEAIRQINNKR